MQIVGKTKIVSYTIEDVTGEELDMIRSAVMERRNRHQDNSNQSPYSLVMASNYDNLLNNLSEVNVKTDK